jgi:hypothetical protein
MRRGTGCPQSWSKFIMEKLVLDSQLDQTSTESPYALQSSATPDGLAEDHNEDHREGD